jgi:DNA-binding MarR family transcriptional regulator
MYDLISFVVRGKVRKEVLKSLDRPMTPTILAEKINNHRSTTSRTILELVSKKLVNCITPKENMGRYYQITPLGKKVINKIKEVENGTQK